MPSNKPVIIWTFFERGDLCKTLEGREEIAPTLCLLGEYDKMEAIS